MKLLVFPLAAALAVAFVPKAQAQFGVKGGVNLAKMTGRDGEVASYKTFYHIGLIFQGNLVGPLSIQPEIQYSQHGGSLKGAFTDYDTKLHYFTVPVLLKLTLGPVFVEAGPQFGVLVNATQNGEVQFSGASPGGATYGQADNQNVTDRYKRTDFDLAAGAGLKLGDLSLGGRFVAGLNDINDAKNLTGVNDPRLQNRVFQVYAGLQFGK